MAQTYAGVPSPNRWITHEAIPASKGSLYGGAAVVNGTAVEAVVLCAGASRGRVRIKTTGAGTLALLFVRPTSAQTPYEAGQPATVAVTGGTETLLTTEDIAGESQAIIRFSPSANGTITYVDWMAL